MWGGDEGGVRGRGESGRSDGEGGGEIGREYGEGERVGDR